MRTLDATVRKPAGLCDQVRTGAAMMRNLPAISFRSPRLGCEKADFGHDADTIGR
jgi:hypothetical protein